ncbi:MAG: hypothetical protein QXQ87_06505 [Halobacteria archaeon]
MSDRGPLVQFAAEVHDPTEATLSVGGQLAGGTQFEGSDTIRVK